MFSVRLNNSIFLPVLDRKYVDVGVVLGGSGNHHAVRMERCRCDGGAAVLVQERGVGLE